MRARPSNTDTDGLLIALAHGITILGEFHFQRRRHISNTQKALTRCLGDIAVLDGRVVQGDGESFIAFREIDIIVRINRYGACGLPAWNRKAGETVTIVLNNLRRNGITVYIQAEIRRIVKRCAPLPGELQTESDIRRGR